MANYSSCRCGNDAKGTQIMQCKECNQTGCYTSGGFWGGSGCWTDKRCPNCGKNAGYRILGRIS